MAMYEYAQSQHVEVGVLVFDGMMIKKGDYDLNALLRGMETHVFERKT